MPLLFVYGTLRLPAGTTAADTQFHHRIADHIVDSRPGTLDGAVLYDFGSYPGIGPGDGSVAGDLFEVTEHGLAEADIIEGHPDFYERRLATITTADGSVVDGWVYWAPAAMLEGRPPIEGGDWFGRNREATTTPLPIPDDDALLEVIDRLGDEPYCWFTSVRPDGRPHTVPMWHVLHGNRLYVVTPGDAVKVANIAANPNVVIALPDPAAVVRIEGWAVAAPAVLAEVAPLFFGKYGWNPAAEPDGTHVVVETVPRSIMSWSDDSSGSWIL